MRSDQDANKDPNQLEREVEQQRREMSETMQALEDRFSSRELYNQASNYIREHGRDYAESFGNSIKANPLPVTITAIGLLWLMIGQRPPASPSQISRPRAGKLKQTGSQLKERASSASDEAARTAQNLRDKAGEARQELSERVSDGMSGMREGMSHSLERMGHTRERMGQALHDSRSNIEQLMHDQPMAMGAIGIALGAIIGAAMPRTEVENRALGDIGEEARRKASGLAEKGYQKAREVGESVSQQVQETAQSHSEEGDGQDRHSSQHLRKTSPASRGPSATPYP